MGISFSCLLLSALSHGCDRCRNRDEKIRFSCLLLSALSHAKMQRTSGTPNVGFSCLLLSALSHGEAGMDTVMVAEFQLPLIIGSISCHLSLL